MCLAELVGLGCAVLVVAGLCSAWRPQPPASMKAAALPATAFLHSRAAAQLPPHYHHNYHHNSAAQPPKLLPLKSCRTALPRIIETITAEAAIDGSAYKLQPNTTTQLMEPILCTQQDHTPQLQKLVVDSGCNNPHNCKQQNTNHTTTDGGQNCTSDHCIQQS